MGKSLGNVVDPKLLVENFGADAVRYHMASVLSFGEDGDFSYEPFIVRINGDLANGLGNLVHRILSLCKKNSAPDGASLALTQAELAEHPVYQVAAKAGVQAEFHFERFDFPNATMAAIRISQAANAQMNLIQPWALLKKGDEERLKALRELHIMAEAVRICAVILAPILPDLSGRILAELGVLGPQGLEGLDSLTWRDTEWRSDPLPGLEVSKKKPTPVFQRIDLEPWQGK